MLETLQPDAIYQPRQFWLLSESLQMPEAEVVLSRLQRTPDALAHLPLLGALLIVGERLRQQAMGAKNLLHVKVISHTTYEALRPVASATFTRVSIMAWKVSG